MSNQIFNEMKANANCPKCHGEGVIHEGGYSIMSKHTPCECVQINEFKEYWNTHYSYISMELTDKEIQEFLDSFTTITRACDMASDYLLSQGLAEVQE